MTAPTPAAARRITPLQTLVLGQILIGTASWAALIAVQTKASYELHQGALFLAAVAMAWGAPTILLSPLVGRVIDSRGPRAVGIAAASLSVAASLGLVLTDGPAALCAMTLLSGVARAFAQPAADAMPSWLPGPAEHVKSSVWLGFATSVPMIAGPALAASLVAVGGTASAFTANAVAYLLGGGVFVLLRLTRTPETEQAKEVKRAKEAQQAREMKQAKGMKQGEEAKEDRSRLGLRGLLTHRGLRFTIVLTLIVWISYGAMTPLEILYIKSVLHRPAGTFATVEMVFGAGLLAATLLIARFDGLLGRRFFLPLSVLLVGAGQFLYSATHSLTFAYLGVGLWGLAAGLFGPACRLSLLQGTPADQHGRAMALWRAVQSFGSLAPPAVAGAVAHFAGVQPTLVAIGSLVVVTGACALTRSRAIQAKPQPAAVKPRFEKVEKV
ncbi:MFS transporter [Streptomyces sp. NPDC058466]|uniref:MFS transporter n=1 Tax=Streptomyces sp. NPDC058466 TaxID=3346512 RepID=UPI00365E19AF